MSDDTFVFNDSGLRKLVKILKQSENKMVKVGILGDKDARENKGSNATIGVRHEFGIGVPLRSFLRMPLIDQLDKDVQQSKAFDEETLKKVINESDITIWLKKLGALAELTIAKAFDSEGFGLWKPSNMKRKKVHQTLVESQQLRDSIGFQVED